MRTVIVIVLTTFLALPTYAHGDTQHSDSEKRGQEAQQQNPRGSSAATNIVREWYEIGHDTSVLTIGDTITLRPSTYSDRHEDVWRVVFKVELQNDSPVLTPVTTYPNFEPVESDKQRRINQYLKTGQLDKLPRWPKWLDPYHEPQSIPIFRARPYRWPVRSPRQSARFAYEVKLVARSKSGEQILLHHALKDRPAKRRKGPSSDKRGRPGQ